MTISAIAHFSILDITFRISCSALVPSPILGFPFILHLWGHFLGQVPFDASSVNAQELSLADMKVLATTVMLSTHIGDKDALS